jgi:hypothetical protein
VARDIQHVFRAAAASHDADSSLNASEIIRELYRFAHHASSRHPAQISESVVALSPALTADELRAAPGDHEIDVTRSVVPQCGEQSNRRHQQGERGALCLMLRKAKT